MLLDIHAILLLADKTLSSLSDAKIERLIPSCIQLDLKANAEVSPNSDIIIQIANMGFKM